MKKTESFLEMIERLKAEGLLNADGGITDKGHAYVEQVKHDLVREQARVMAELSAEKYGYDLEERNEIWERAEAA